MNDFMQLISTNIASKMIRKERKDGRDFLVAPVVLITEGVHNNLLYPAEELKKYPVTWNNRPLPLMHPTNDNGNPISANDPDVLMKTSVGQVFNVRFDEATDQHKARLAGEVWIDEVRMENMASKNNAQAVELMRKLDNNEPIEISTGLFTDDEHTSGNFNGKSYDAIARNHRPDHLAILATGVGACNIKDGCGFPRTNEDESGESGDKLKQLGAFVMKLFTSDGPAVNELTHKDQERAIDEALRQKLQLKHHQFIHIVDIGDGWVVYRFTDSDTGKSVLYRRQFTIDARDQITMSDEDVSVQRRTEFIPQPMQTPDSTTARTLTSNDQWEEINRRNTAPNQNKEEPTMDKIVDALIANESNKFTKDDRPSLMKLNEEQLRGLSPSDDGASDEPKTNCDCKETPCTCEKVAANDGGKTKTETKTDDDIKVNDDKAKANDEKYMTVAQANEIITKAISDALPKALTEQRDFDSRKPIIERLKANDKCQIEVKHLEKMDAEALKQLEISITPGNYAGVGGIRGSEEDIKANAPEPMPALFPVKEESA